MFYVWPLSSFSIQLIKELYLGRITNISQNVILNTINSIQILSYDDIIGSYGTKIIFQELPSPGSTTLWNDETLICGSVSGTF